MSYPTQMLIILDAELTATLEEIVEHLPHERDERVVLRYSEVVAPAVIRHGDGATPVDWDGVSEGISTLATKARDACAQARTAAQLFITGRAPLAAFAQLGLELSAWSASQTLLNRRRNGTWDILPLVSTEGSKSNHFFDDQTGVPLSEVSQATGQVVVFVSTIGMPEAPRLALREMVQNTGEDVAGFVELRTSEAVLIDVATAPQAAQELAEAISQIPGSYPYASGIALAVGGPATLAFLAGRAINRNIHHAIRIAEYEGPEYRHVIELPLRRRIPSVSDRLEDVAARQETLDRAVAALNDLRHALAPEDFAGVLSATDAEIVIARLKTLEVVGPDGGDAFRLSILQGRVALGLPLLEVLRTLEPDDQVRIAQLLLVHEVHHFDQSIQSTDYMEIGRAGVALEEVDFWADVFSVSVLVRWQSRRSKQSAKGVFRSTLLSYLDSLLLGVRSFDRAEQGERIGRLFDRRLRRYLIWHLQRARAATVKSIDSMDQMLGARLIVELAPLRGSLDSRWDKVVDRPLPNTELVVVFRGALDRFHQQPGFDPSSLVEAVRSFDEYKLRNAMKLVVGKWFDRIAPWAATRVSKNP